MRIAVLFFGRLTKSIEQYTNILDSIGREHTLDIFFSSDNAPDSLVQECVQLYSPVAYNNTAITYTGVLEQYVENIDGVQVGNMIRHFINKYRVYSLLEHHIEHTNTQYDCVLSIRFDLAFGHAIPFLNINENTVYIPSGADWLGGINDQLAYGDVPSMKKYMNMWLNTEEILDKGLSRIHAESITSANITYTGLQVVRFDLSYDIRR
jgi:hypothetical protein